MIKSYFVLVFIFISKILISQTINLGSWNIINVKSNINNSWSFFSEIQLRSLKFYNNFHYYEYKGGLNYKPNKQLVLSLAAGSYQTYKEGGNFVLPKNNNELRIWPQVLLLQSIGSLKIEQRYRAEFRFTSNGYKNRFRYRLGLAYPIKSRVEILNRIQININNELFFTNLEPYFERNRFITSLQYKPKKTISFQIGYVHQFDYRINDETGKDFLQLAVFFEFWKK